LRSFVAVRRKPSGATLTGGLAPFRYKGMQCALAGRASFEVARFTGRT
jgi:hypothetical protein